MLESVEAPDFAGAPGHERARLGRRRRVMAGLVVGTILTLVAAMAWLLGRYGLTTSSVLMIALFALNTPWVVLGFWNAVIGFAILHGRGDPLGTVNPLVARARPDQPILGRVAVIMPAYNEDPERVFRHLRSIAATLDTTGEAAAFELFLLSDTRDPEIAREEEARFAAWRARDRRPERLHYRRRERNTGHKVGNIRDFCERWGDRFDYMIVLDADSVMSGAALVRLTRIMESNPRLGILQTLPVGLPSLSPFARIFQFGMRQGMRPYTVGSAWWQGDEGPYWGHNAILRVAPFREQCGLPILPGRPPFGGEVLSHDQVEAVLMRRAGYEVRVLPVEDGSFEENPPTLPDFLKRDLRWCQGNLQHTRLLGMPGVRPLGRLQMALGILMYLAAPLWLGFLAVGFGSAMAQPHVEIRPDAPGLALFVTMMTLVFAPKLLGILDILLRAGQRRAYGGAPRILAGSAVELVFSMLLAPVLSLTHTVFMAGLLLGRQVRWDPQRRDGHAVPLGQALRGLWPHMATGLALVAALAAWAPSVLPWAAPVLVGLLLAAPFTWLTSRVAAGRVLARLGLCRIPEEHAPPPEVAMLGLELPAPLARPRAAPVRPEAAAAPARVS